MLVIEEIHRKLQQLGDPRQALILRRFFKTGPGEYGEGDVFVGLKVPETRKLARQYEDLSLSESIKLLHSPIHEARLMALLILVHDFQRGEPDRQREICRLYLENSRHVNNWDLVDLSAPSIVGPQIIVLGQERFRSLAASPLLWDRRIAIMATFHGIKKGEFSDTLQVAGLLLRDKEDLIHKALGWMLREIGKRDQPAEEAFLRIHYRSMPRTMLRYAIERFPEDLRLRYLRGEI
jgi:3-methyladenine DNA glycosylase AlkD